PGQVRGGGLSVPTGPACPPPEPKVRPRECQAGQGGAIGSSICTPGAGGQSWMFGWTRTANPQMLEHAFDGCGCRGSRTGPARHSHTADNGSHMTRWGRSCARFALPEDDLGPLLWSSDSALAWDWQ